MKKIIISLILLSTVFFITPTLKANSNKIVDERHSKEELGEYGDTTKVTLASDRTNLLIKIAEESDGYTRKNYPIADEFNEYKKNRYKKHNDKFLSRMNVEYDDIYVSKYSSYIELSFNANSKDKLDKAIDKLVNYDFVEKVYIQDDYRPAEKLGGAKGDVQASSSLISDLYGGLNIKIGLLEYGVCNTSHANLVNSRITTRNEPLFIETTTEHANLMASIIVGTGGMAPNALLFSVQMFGNPVGEIDWLIEKNVSVCNVSIGDGEGSYSSSSAYIDYAALTYGITFCCAVGNDGDEGGYVSNMAMAYNCISVGAGSVNSAASYTSTLVPNGQVRPVVMGPGCVGVSNFEYTYYEGTSVATAVCTGVVALVQRYNTANIYNPARIRALMMANARELNDQPYESNDFYDGGGTGLISLQNCITNYNKILERVNDYTVNSNAFIASLVAVFNEGERWRVAVSYMTRLDSNDVPRRINYKISVIDPEERTTIEVNNCWYDSYEFTTGVATYYCQLIFEIDQVESKPFPDEDTVYFAYRAAPVGGK